MQRRAQARGRELHAKGVRLLVDGKLPQALALLYSATTAAPHMALAWHDLAEALRLSGRVDEAKTAAVKAIELDPHSVLSARLYAQILMTQGRYREAASLLHPAAAVLDDHELSLEAANALAHDNRHDTALKMYLKAVSRVPHDARGHLGMALSFIKLRNAAAAYESARTASILAPECSQTLGVCLHHALHAARWERLDDDIARLVPMIERGLPAMPFEVLTLPGVSPHTMRLAARNYGLERTRDVTPLPAKSAQPRDAAKGETLRIGYVSNDFFDHATAHLLVEVLEKHDRRRCTVHLYCYSKDDGSLVRRRVLAAADALHLIAEMDDQSVAAKIRADDIDILIDLKGYTLGSRPGIFAHRAAPVQVNYLGHPGTLGVPWIDYIVTDPIVTPPTAVDDYSEQPAWMPQAYQPNDRKRALPPAPTRAACGLPGGHFVFCSFNASYKITPATFDLWCRILQAVPQSVLWLLESHTDACAQLRANAAARGVDPQRLIFAPRIPVHLHLARTQLADLVLDTLPVNAHTTAADALWAGVPVLTCPGTAFVSRVAASLVTAAGLPELVMADLAQYEAEAVRLATDPQRHTAVRQRLAAQRMTCALFDSDRYTRALEDLYQQMHERAVAGLGPAALHARAA